MFFFFKRTKCYIQHYPRTKKYISLFPPESRQAQVDSVSTNSDDNDHRVKVRALVREQMQRGEISKQPENELEGGSRRPANFAPDHSRRNEGREPDKKVDHTSSAAHYTAERDDFFGEDYPEDGSDSEGSDAPEMEVQRTSSNGVVSLV